MQRSAVLHFVRQMHQPGGSRGHSQLARGAFASAARTHDGPFPGAVVQGRRGQSPQEVHEHVQVRRRQRRHRDIQRRQSAGQLHRRRQEGRLVLLGERSGSRRTEERLLSGHDLVLKGRKVLVRRRLQRIAAVGRSRRFR